MADRAKDLEALKRKKPQEAAERERVLRQLEEDKAERQLKFQSPAAAAAALEAQPIAEASSSRSAAEQSASATLNIRTEEGAVRHTFSADTTLAQVRDATDSSRKVVQALLERMDADGITRRTGDTRIVRRGTAG